MAAGKKKIWLLLSLGLPLLNVLYQCGQGALAKTGTLREEAEKMEREIKEIKEDKEHFSKKWAMDTQTKENETKMELPDQIKSSEVLRYFVTNFEEKNPTVQFNQVSPGPVLTSAFIADPENKAIKVRSARYQFKAKMSPSLSFAYIDHVEKYPGSVNPLNFSLTSGGAGTADLMVELELELFATPKEWLGDGAVVAALKEEKRKSEVSTLVGQNWFQTEDLNPKPPEPKPEEKTLPKKMVAKKVVQPAPRFFIQQFVGDSVVIQDGLYEAGDSVDGWEVVSINPAGKSIIVRKGTVSYRLVVK